MSLEPHVGTQILEPAFNLADTLTSTAIVRLGMQGVRALRVRVLLTVDGGMIMRGHTLLVGSDRMQVSVPSMLERDRECSVFFAVTHEDETVTIVGTGKVVKCKPNPKGGFRAELDFTPEDQDLLDTIVNTKDRWAGE